ncbi:MAG: hypothetical protein AAFV88_23980 [Planctomycetota bacterium]
MRLYTLLILCLFLAPCFVGCGKETEATGPEMGSIAKYLEENPEEAEDDPEDEAQSEDEAFDAAGS